MDMSPSESHLRHHVSLQDLLLFVLFFFLAVLIVSLFNPRVACLVYSKLHALLDYGTTIFQETRKATLTPTLKRSHYKKNSFPDEENSLFKLKEIAMRTYLSLRILTHSFLAAFQAAFQVAKNLHYYYCTVSKPLCE